MVVVIMESGSKQRLRHVFEKLPAAHHISSKTVSPTCVSARAMLPLLPTTSDMVSCELTCKLLYTWICISTKFGGFWTLCLLVFVVVGNNYMLFHCMLFCVRQDFFGYLGFFLSQFDLLHLLHITITRIIYSRKTQPHRLFFFLLFFLFSI